jgi:hypothetical protein
LLAKPLGERRLQYWLIAAMLYALAKLFEFYDSAIYSANTVLSGHTLKHFAAAAGCGVAEIFSEAPHRSWCRMPLTGRKSFYYGRNKFHQKRTLAGPADPGDHFFISG